MSFDARHPHALRQPRDESPFPAALVAPRVSPGVLAKVGEAFSTALSMLQASLATLRPLAEAEQARLDAGLIEIARLEAFGLQIQAVARLLSRTAPAPAERVDLARAAREAVGDWTRAAHRRGVSLVGLSQSLELDGNAGAINQLLDLGLEFAMQIGSRIEIGAALEGLAQHPVLSIRVQRSQPIGEASDAAFDDLHWLLFAELARAIGLVPQRLDDGQVLTMTLGFPAAWDAATPGDTASAALPHTAPARGRRVLLVEPQDMSRLLASRLMSSVGMRVAPASTIDQARAGLKDETPDVVVTGIPIGDARLHALLDEVRAAQPRVRVIELVDDDSAFDFSVPGSDNPARIGRHNLTQTLVRAVSQELDAAWPS